jgi:hypothetical protein
VIATGLALAGLVRKRPALSLLALGAVAALCGMAWCWGYGVGQAGIGKAVATERQAQAEQRVQAVERAHEDYRERVRMGEQAAMALRDQLAARDRRLADFDRRMAHGPQLLATEACPRPGDVRLPVGAVRLYDAALGRDDQQLPAGACGAAEAGPGAGVPGARSSGSSDDCQQPSAVTVDRLQATAVANAGGFGECWARLNKLVDFLRARQGAARGLTDAAGAVASDF